MFESNKQLPRRFTDYLSLLTIVSLRTLQYHLQVPTKITFELDILQICGVTLSLKDLGVILFYITNFPKFSSLRYIIPYLCWFRANILLRSVSHVEITGLPLQALKKSLTAKWKSELRRFTPISFDEVLYWRTGLKYARDSHKTIRVFMI